jgi:amino acid adenylation domain-containing protein
MPQWWGSNSSVLGDSRLELSPATVRTQIVFQQPFAWPSTLFDQLRAFSASEGVSVFIGVVAGLETLLYRYTGQHEFVIRCLIPESTKGGRYQVRVPFANATRIKTDFRGNPSFRDVITQVREGVRDGGQESTLEKAHELFDRDNTLSPDQFPRVLFTNSPDNGQQTVQPHPRSSAGSTNDTHQPPPWDLCLAVWADGGVLRGNCAYSTSLFDRETINRMIAHLQTLLESGLRNPDEDVSRLPMLTEFERRQILVEWNNTECSYPEEKCIHELFEAQVERSPDSIAAVYGTVELSYRELNGRANQLAHHLRRLGARSEGVIGLYVDGPVEQIVGLLGILKAGAGYIPLDPAYPKERLKAMLHDAQVPLLVTQKHLLADVPAEPWQEVVCLDAGWTEDGAPSRSNLENVATPDGIAYVLYTSGSTGTPKGIPITHRSVVNFLDSMQRELCLTPQDRMLAATTINFDMAVLEIYLPLMAGAAISMVDRETAVDGVAMAEHASDPRITLIQATPATWQMLLEAGWIGNPRLKGISGGEAMSRELAGELLSRCGSVWNGYGPTETTVYASVYKIGAVGPERVPIGRPIGNTQLYILDHHLQPRPVGIPGEIYVGGLGVAKGYLNRPELTAEAFIPDTFGRKAKGRLYKTGDYGRYRADGNIEYLGRIDHQVKIRGFRIELDEIEGALRQHPAVHQALVLAREDVPGDKKLVAYIVAEQRARPTVAQVLSYLQARLPYYMVPSACVFLKAFPLTLNGKVDRRALPSPESALSRIEEDYVAPKSDSERQLAVAWKKVLGRQRIGTRDNFFYHGGDSLLAVRLIREIEKTCGKKLPLDALYQAPTIEQLANTLGREGGSASLLVPIQPVGSRPPFFWFHGEHSNVVLPDYLGDEQPLYGIVHQGHDGRPARYTTVETMANHYKAEIRRVQPRGPYYLGGYCFGGIVAFETAQRLQKDGETVDLLALLDPDKFTHPQMPVSHVSVPRRVPGPRESYRDQIRRHFETLKSLPSGEIFEYCRVRVGGRISEIPFIRKSSAMCKTAVCRICFRLGLSLPARLFSHYMLGIYAAAMVRYMPQPYSGRVLIWTTENTFDDGIWKNLSREVEINEIKGDHYQILKEPNVSAWAKRLDQELRGVCSRVRVSSNVSLGWFELAVVLDWLSSFLSACAF